MTFLLNLPLCDLYPPYILKDRFLTIGALTFYILSNFNYYNELSTFMGEGENLLMKIT